MSSCGDCTVCCIYLDVNTPEFSKEPNIACEHLTEKGCGIYNTRFKICREYKCVWLQVASKYPDFNIDWRPDNVGLIVSSGKYEEELDACPINIVEIKEGAFDPENIEPYLDVIFNLAGKQPEKTPVMVKLIGEEGVRELKKD